MIAVWFSCGAASAAALKLTVNLYGKDSVRAVNNPVLEEHTDNRRFLRDVEKWTGVEIETALHPLYPTASAADVWRRRGGMAFPHGAPCTVHLKKEARQHWEQTNHVDWHVLGFTADEKKRHERFVLTERPNVLPVLIDTGMTKTDCARLIQAAGIALPEIYIAGGFLTPTASVASRLQARPTGTWCGALSPRSSPPGPSSLASLVRGWCGTRT